MKYVLLVFSTTIAKNWTFTLQVQAKKICLKQNFVFFFLYSFCSSFFFFSQFWKGQFPLPCSFCCYSNISLCWPQIHMDSRVASFHLPGGAHQETITHGGPSNHPWMGAPSQPAMVIGALTKIWSFVASYLPFCQLRSKGHPGQKQETLQPGIEPESLRWWGSDFLSTLSGASGCICNCIGASIPQCMWIGQSWISKVAAGDRLWA